MKIKLQLIIFFCSIVFNSCNSNSGTTDSSNVSDTISETANKEISIYILNELDSLDKKLLPSALLRDSVSFAENERIEIIDNYSCKISKEDVLAYFRVFWDDTGLKYLCISYSKLDTLNNQISSALYFLKKEKEKWKDVSHLLVPSFAIDIIELQIDNVIKFQRIHKKEKLFAFKSEFGIKGFSINFEKANCVIYETQMDENDSIRKKNFLNLIWKDNVLVIDELLEENSENLLSDSELENAKVYYSFEDAISDSDLVYILDISGKNLSKIPKQIKHLKKLQILNLSENSISVIPDEIGYLSNLQVLRLNNNNISIISENIGNLTNLEEIYLTNNSLSKIPKQFENLKKLRIINIDGNNLDALPVQILYLDLLAAINASDNSINLVSPDISNLKNLIYLNLSNNLLTSLPDNISDLTFLKELNLSNNNINSKTIEKLKKQMTNTTIKN